MAKRTVSTFRDLLSAFEPRTVLEMKEKKGPTETENSLAGAATKILELCGNELSFTDPGEDSRSKSEASHASPPLHIGQVHGMQAGLVPGVFYTMAALFERLDIVKPTSACASLMTAAREAAEWDDQLKAAGNNPFRMLAQTTMRQLKALNDDDNEIVAADRLDRAQTEFEQMVDDLVAYSTTPGHSRATGMKLLHQLIEAYQGCAIPTVNLEAYIHRLTKTLWEKVRDLASGVSKSASAAKPGDISNVVGPLYHQLEMQCGPKVDPEVFYQSAILRGSGQSIGAPAAGARPHGLLGGSATFGDDDSDDDDGFGFKAAVSVHTGHKPGRRTALEAVETLTPDEAQKVFVSSVQQIVNLVARFRDNSDLTFGESEDSLPGRVDPSNQAVLASPIVQRAMAHAGRHSVRRGLRSTGEETKGSGAGGLDSDDAGEDDDNSDASVGSTHSITSKVAHGEDVYFITPSRESAHHAGAPVDVAGGSRRDGFGDYDKRVKTRVFQEIWCARRSQAAQVVTESVGNLTPGMQQDLGFQLRLSNALKQINSRDRDSDTSLVAVAWLNALHKKFAADALDSSRVYEIVTQRARLGFPNPMALLHAMLTIFDTALTAGDLPVMAVSADGTPKMSKSQSKRHRQRVRKAAGERVDEAANAAATKQLGCLYCELTSCPGVINERSCKHYLTRAFCILGIGPKSKGLMPLCAGCHKFLPRNHKCQGRALALKSGGGKGMEKHAHAFWLEKFPDAGSGAAAEKLAVDYRKRQQTTNRTRYEGPVSRGSRTGHARRMARSVPAAEPLVHTHSYTLSPFDIAEVPSDDDSKE